MKKILALALAASMVVPTFASAMNREEFIWATGVPESAVPAQMDVKVDSNMLVKRSSSTTYQEGPISVTSTSYPTFDFKDIMYMENVRDAFENYYVKSEAVIKANLGEDYGPSLQAFYDTEVTGEFDVSIIYPKKLTFDSKYVDDAKESIGFGEEVSTIFEEKGRIDEEYDDDNRITTITMYVAGPMDEAGNRMPLTCKDLHDNIDDYLPDLTYECKNVKPKAYDTYTVYGKMSGWTKVGGEELPAVSAQGSNDPITTVNYTAYQTGTDQTVDTMDATIKIKKESSGGGGGGSSNVTPVVSAVSLTFDVLGNTKLMDPIVKEAPFVFNTNDVVAPVVTGRLFKGWCTDPACTDVVTGDITITKNTTLYGKYAIISAPGVFETDEHLVYIMGYPDGTVQPYGNITREEVAKALYRLLKKSVRESITVETNNFYDVESTRWSNCSISSMANAGYLKGYEDGSFRPGRPITRAEFATMMVRFFPAEDINTEGADPFSDISGHWANGDIKASAKLGFVEGYEDGTFRPDTYITRAEAMTIINRITVRHTDAAGVLENAKNWPDIKSTDWFYFEILEATNAHDYVRRADGYYEDWTKFVHNEFDDLDR